MKDQRHSRHTDKKILKRSQINAFSEMERFVLGTKSFHLQYDSFQTGNETNLFGDET